MVDPKRVIEHDGSLIPVVDLTGDADATSSSPASSDRNGRKRKRSSKSPSPSNLTRPDDVSGYRAPEGPSEKMDRVGQSKESNVVDLTNDEDDAQAGALRFSSSGEVSRLVPGLRSELGSSSGQSNNVPARPKLLSTVSAFNVLEDMTGLKLSDSERRTIKSLWREGRLENIFDESRTAVAALDIQAEFPATMTFNKTMKLITVFKSLVREKRVLPKPSSESMEFLCEPRPLKEPTSTIHPSTSRPYKAREIPKKKNSVTLGETMPLEIRQKPKFSRTGPDKKCAHVTITSAPSLRIAGDVDNDSNPASRRGNSEAEQSNAITFDQEFRSREGGSSGELNRDHEAHSNSVNTSNEHSKISRDSAAHNTEPTSADKAGLSELNRRTSVQEASAASVRREPEPSDAAATDPPAPGQSAVVTTSTPNSAGVVPKKTVLKKVGNPGIVKQKLKRSSIIASGESRKLTGSSLSLSSFDKHHKKPAAFTSASSASETHPGSLAVRDPRGELAESRSVSESVDSVLSAPPKVIATESPTLADVVSSRTEKTPEQTTVTSPPRPPHEDIGVHNDSLLQPMRADVTDGLPTLEAQPIPVSYAAVESIVRKHVHGMYDDHEYFMRSWLPRARRCYQRGSSIEEDQRYYNATSEKGTIPESHLQKESPFASMGPVQTSCPAKASATRVATVMQQDVFADRNNKGVKSYFSVPATAYRSDVAEVPPYTSYVSLKQNVLAENNKQLLYWPYFSETQNQDKGKAGLWRELNERFDIVYERRPHSMLRTEQSHKFGPYVDAILEELGCDYGAVLHYLLDPEPILKSNFGMSEADMRIWESRDDSRTEGFDSTKKRWVLVLSGLPPASDQDLALAGLACKAFLRICGFSIWHIAKRSELAQLSADKSTRYSNAARETPTIDSGAPYRTLACRVCHLHNCPYHGEIREEPATDEEFEDDASRAGSDDASASSKESAFDEPPNINFKKQVAARPRPQPESTEPHNIPAPQQSRRGYSYWLTKSQTHMLHERAPFYPCSHEGSCEDAKCQCWREDITCEKTCACASSCNRRFQGCRCTQKGKACWQNHNCDCFRLNRECDEDLCGTCGAAEVLDPVNRYNTEATARKCNNVSIQRNVPKRTLLGQSEVHGFGLYMGEDVKEHEYLGEYKGEVIARTEADRRGAIYHHKLTNYLFALNRDQDIDATNAGNKFRFVNNSELDETINCYARPLLCNTVTRIGMFAKRDIHVGEELFFNYGYPKEQTKDFWEKGQSGRTKAGTAAKAVAVKTKKSRKGTAKPKNKGKGKALASATSADPSSEAAAATASPLRSSRSRSTRAIVTARELEMLGETMPDEEVRAVFREEEEEAEEEKDEDYMDEEHDEYEVPMSEDEDAGSEYGGQGAATPPRRSGRGTKRKFGV